MMEYREVRIKRGKRKDLPLNLPSGVLAYCVDTSELFVGMGDSLPPQPITDGTKWLIDSLEEGFEQLTSKENVKIKTPKNIVFHSLQDEEKEIRVELGKTTKANGRNTFALFPHIEIFYDEFTQIETSRTQLDLGTDKNPFTNVWVGDSFVSSTSNSTSTVNGFTEQWGKVTVIANTTATVQLPLSYSDLNYSIQISVKSDNFAQARFFNVTPSSFEVQVKDYDADIYWRTIGR